MFIGLKIRLDRGGANYGWYGKVAGLTCPEEGAWRYVDTSGSTIQERRLSGMNMTLRGGFCGGFGGGGGTWAGARGAQPWCPAAAQGGAGAGNGGQATTYSGR